MRNGIKTTIAASMIGLCGVGLVAALIFGKIDKETFNIAIASVGAFGGVLIGLLAGDQPKKENKQ